MTRQHTPDSIDAIGLALRARGVMLTSAVIYPDGSAVLEIAKGLTADRGRLEVIASLTRAARHTNDCELVLSGLAEEYTDARGADLIRPTDAGREALERRGPIHVSGRVDPKRRRCEIDGDGVGKLPKDLARDVAAAFASLAIVDVDAPANGEHPAHAADVAGVPA